MTYRVRPRRAVLAALCATVVLLALASTASAALWLTSGTAGGAGKAATLGSPTAVTVPSSTVTNGSVAISWTNGAVPAGATMLLVERKSGGTYSAVCGSGATPLSAATTSCTDVGVTDGTYQYRVTSRIGTAWSSSSNDSASVVLLATPVVSGIRWSGLTPDGGKTLTCNFATLAAVTCQISGVGNKGGFTAAKVQLMDQNQNPINAASTVSVTLSKDSGTFTPASPGMSVASGASVTGNAFGFATANGNVTGTLLASATVNGSTFTVNVKVIP